MVTYGLVGIQTLQASLDAACFAVAFSVVVPAEPVAFIIVADAAVAAGCDACDDAGCDDKEGRFHDDVDDLIKFDLIWSE